MGVMSRRHEKSTSRRQHLGTLVADSCDAESSYLPGSGCDILFLAVFAEPDQALEHGER